MIRTHVLDNGTTLLIDEMRDVRSFALGVLRPGGLGRRAAVAAGHVPLPRAPPLQADAAADERRDRPRHRPPRRRRGRVHDQGVHRVLRPHARRPLRGSPRSDRRRRARSGFPGRRTSRRSAASSSRRSARPTTTPTTSSTRSSSAPSGRSILSARPILGTADTVGAIGRGPVRLLRLPVRARQLHRRARRLRRPGPGARCDREAFSRRGATGVRGCASLAGPARHAAKPHSHVDLRRREGLEQVHVCLGVAAPSADEPPALRRGAPRHRAGRRHVLPAVPGSAREARPGVLDRLLAQRVSRRWLRDGLGGVRAEEPAAPDRRDSRASSRKLKRGGVAEGELAPRERESQRRTDPCARVDGLAHVRGGAAGASTSAGSSGSRSSIAKVEAVHRRTRSAPRPTACSTAARSPSPSSGTPSALPARPPRPVAGALAPVREGASLRLRSTRARRLRSSGIRARPRRPGLSGWAAARHPDPPARRDVPVRARGPASHLRRRGHPVFRGRDIPSRARSGSSPTWRFGGVSRVGALLDFAAGYGRTTRFLVRDARRRPDHGGGDRCRTPCGFRRRPSACAASCRRTTRGRSRLEGRVRSRPRRLPLQPSARGRFEAWLGAPLRSRRAARPPRLLDDGGARPAGSRVRMPSSGIAFRAAERDDAPVAATSTERPGSRRSSSGAAAARAAPEARLIFRAARVLRLPGPLRPRSAAGPAARSAPSRATPWACSSGRPWKAASSRRGAGHRATRTSGRRT